MVLNEELDRAKKRIEELESNQSLKQSKPMKAQAEHLEEAEKMAHHIMERFDLEQQNQVIKTIGNTIKNIRRMDADKMHKQAEMLTDSVKQLEE